MKDYSKLLVTLVAGAVLAMASTASATFDNFDDDSLDASKWGSFLKPARPNQTVTETGGKLELYDGASIYTQQEFDPNAGVVTATGSFTVDATSERLFFNFFGGDFGGAANQRSGGLSWFIFGSSGGGGTFNGDSVRLNNVSTGSFTSGSNPPGPSQANSLTGVVGTNVNADDPTILDFTMTAQPGISTFTLTVNPNDASGASGSSGWFVTWDGDLEFGHTTNHVIFENNNGRTLKLDNISVVSGAVPEPASLILVGLGALMLGLRRRMWTAG